MTTVYDARGNVLELVTETDLGADGAIDSRHAETSVYDRQGNLLSGVIEDDRPGEQGDERQALRYTHTGNRIDGVEESYLSGTLILRRVSLQQRDAHGKLLSEIVDVGMEPVDGSIDSRASTTFAYEGSERPLSPPEP